MPPNSLAPQHLPRTRAPATARGAAAPTLGQTAPVHKIHIAQDVRFALYAGEGASSALLIAAEHLRWLSALRSLWRLLYHHDMVVLHSNPTGWDQVKHALQQQANAQASDPTAPGSDSSIVVEQQVVHLFRLRWFPFVEWASPGVIELHLVPSTEPGADGAILTTWLEHSPATSSRTALSDASLPEHSPWRAHAVRGPVLLSGWAVSWIMRPSPSYSLTFPSVLPLPPSEEESTPTLPSYELQRGRQDRPSLVARVLQSTVGAVCSLALGVRLPLVHPLLGVCPRMFFHIPLVHRQSTEERAALYADRMGLPLHSAAARVSIAPPTPIAVTTDLTSASPVLNSAREAPSCVAVTKDEPPMNPMFPLKEICDAGPVYKPEAADKEDGRAESSVKPPPASSSSKLPGNADTEPPCTFSAEEEMQMHVSIKVPASPSEQSPVKDSPTTPHQAAEAPESMEPAELHMTRSPFQEENVDDWTPRIPLAKNDERILAYIRNASTPVEENHDHDGLNDVYPADNIIAVQTFPRLTALGLSTATKEERGIFELSSGPSRAGCSTFGMDVCSTFTPARVPSRQLAKDASAFGPSSSLPHHEALSYQTISPAALVAPHGTFCPAAGRCETPAMSASNAVADSVFSPAAASTPKVRADPAVSMNQGHSADTNNTALAHPHKVSREDQDDASYRLEPHTAAAVARDAHEAPSPLFGPSSALPNRYLETMKSFSPGRPRWQAPSLFGPSCAPLSSVDTDTTFRPAAEGKGATFLPAAASALGHPDSVHTAVLAGQTSTMMKKMLAPAAATPFCVFGQDLDPIPVETTAAGPAPRTVHRKQASSEPETGHPAVAASIAAAGEDAAHRTTTTCKAASEPSVSNEANNAEAVPVTRGDALSPGCLFDRDFSLKLATKARGTGAGPSAEADIFVSVADAGAAHAHTLDGPPDEAGEVVLAPAESGICLLSARSSSRLFEQDSVASRIAERDTEAEPRAVVGVALGSDVKVCRDGTGGMSGAKIAEQAATDQPRLETVAVDSKLGSAFEFVAKTAQAKGGPERATATQPGISSAVLATVGMESSAPSVSPQQDEDVLEKAVKVAKTATAAKAQFRASGLEDAQALTATADGPKPERVELGGDGWGSSSVGRLGVPAGSRSSSMPVAIPQPAPIAQLTALATPSRSMASTSSTSVASPAMSAASSSKDSLARPATPAALLGSELAANDGGTSGPSSSSERGLGHPLSTDSPPPKMSGLSRSSKKSKGKKGRGARGRGRGPARRR